jgi:16S rRNA (adenine1518-N6/adenine1519-N6)-dimethyltransferase
MGVLTKYLLIPLPLCYEIDTESVDYLDANYPKLKDKIISKIFFVMILMKSFKVSSLLCWKFRTTYQLKLFYELKHQIPEFAGMFQKKLQSASARKKGDKAYEFSLFSTNLL